MSFYISPECISCGNCADECPIGAIKQEITSYVIKQDVCTECGACFFVCDDKAILRKQIYEGAENQEMLPTSSLLNG